jgi:hypothetical protein
MTDRERSILDRELKDSARNAIVTPLDETSDGDGILGKWAKIEMNPAIRGGDSWNVGIPSQSLDEPRASSRESDNSLIAIDSIPLPFAESPF